MAVKHEVSPCCCEIPQRLGDVLCTEPPKIVGKLATNINAPKPKIECERNAQRTPYLSHEIPCGRVVPSPCFFSTKFNQKKNLASTTFFETKNGSPRFPSRRSSMTSKMGGFSKVNQVLCQKLPGLKTFRYLT